MINKVYISQDFTNYYQHSLIYDQSNVCQQSMITVINRVTTSNNSSSQIDMYSCINLSSLKQIINNLTSTIEY